MSSSDTCAWNDTLCNQLSDNLLVARLSQRDLEYQIGIDQVYLPGINVNNMASNLVFWLRSALDLGISALFMDLEWSGTKWTLCDDSAKRCFTVEEVCEVLDDFIGRTDTNLEVSLLRLAFRFKSPTNLTLADYVAMNSSDFFAALAPIQNRVFTPKTLVDLQNIGQVSSAGRSDDTNKQSMWPSLTQVLLTQKQRVVVTTDRTLLPANNTFTPLYGTAFDAQMPVSQCNPIPWPELSPASSDLATLAAIPMRSLSVSGASESDLWGAINVGYSPVYNGSLDNSTLLSLSGFGQRIWAPTQPTVESSSQHGDMLDNQNYSMCAVQTLDGWYVKNCYQEEYLLCQGANGLDWKVSESRYTVFAGSSDQCCPNNFVFATPSSILETFAVRNAMIKRNVSSAWTLANSLSLQNCWVEGLQTYCPYNVVQSNRNGISQLVVAGCVAFGLLVVMVALEYRHLRMPLRPVLLKRKRKQE